MIEIIYELGKRVPGKDLPISPVKTPAHLVILNFEYGSAHREEFDQQKAELYRWVGNRRGNTPQDFLITDNLIYLLGKSPFNLLSELEKTKLRTSTLYNRLRKLVKLNILNLKDVSGKPLFILDPHKVLREDEEALFWKKLKEKAKKSFSSIEELAQELSEDKFFKDISDALRETLAPEVSKKERLYWTVADKEGPLVFDSGYEIFLKKQFSPQIPEDAPLQSCHLCNRQALVISDTKKFKFLKFFNTDKPGFAPGMRSLTYPSLFGVCSECYHTLFVGDRLVAEQLQSRLAGKAVFLLPYPVPDEVGIYDLSRLFVRRMDAAREVKRWHEFERELREDVQFRRDWENVKHLIRMDLVFATISNSAVKIHRVIHEVPPSRLDELDEARQNTRKWAEEIFGEEEFWNLDLGAQFKMFPIPKKAKVPEMFLTYLESLLQRYPFGWERLTEIFLKGARLLHTGGTRGYRMKNVSLQIYMVQTLILRKYLRYLGLLTGISQTGGIMMKDILPEHLAQYMEEAGLSDRKAALFLLGYVMGKIGEEQRGTKSPAILNAVTFTGMDEIKIKRLFNHVFSRMRYYLKNSAYREAEKIMAIAQSIYNASRDTVSTHEATYWVLAGYGFGRLARFRA